MASNAWKDLERKVAKFFNTTRRKRGDDFSQKDVEIAADIEEWLGEKNKIFSGVIIAECKYRSNSLGIVDDYTKLREKNKISIGIIGEDVLMVSLEDFKELFIELASTQAIHYSKLPKYHLFQLKESVPKYVDEYINQARKYNEVLPKQNSFCDVRTSRYLPILCAAKRGRKGIYAVFRIEDFQSFFKA